MIRSVESLAAGRADSGRTLQDFLAARLGVSKRAAKAAIDAKSVWVNRKCVWMARHTLENGDLVEVPKSLLQQGKAAKMTAGRSAAAARSATRSHIRILVETPDFIVCDKPSGTVSSGDGASVESILRAQTGIETLQAVHRLDRDTTGCMILAKTAEAFEKAVEVFKTHSVKKQYVAIVAGRFPYRFHTIDAQLDGQNALSHVALQAAGDDASFLKVSITTGRTHQIRRHLAGIRFPVIGDRTFGLKRARDARMMAVPRQMLHASSVELPDPMRRGETLKAHSPLPADFRAALKLFGMGK